MAHELTGPDFASGIAMSDLSENTPLLGHAHGEAVVLIRQGAEVRALGASCSHYGGPLAEGLVVGATVRCPWHHACFDLRTGEALGAPALDPIVCYEVQRRGDRVIVGSRQSLAQENRPPNVAANRYYEPTDRGFEADLIRRLDRIREIYARGASPEPESAPPEEHP